VVAQAVWPRIAVALIATLLVAWFVVLARDQHVGSAAAGRIVDHPLMPKADWDRVMADLDRADLLDPSTDWSLTRANYLVLRDRGAARRAAEAILRREPDNLGAWVVILETTRGRDQARAERAAREIRRLNPLPRAPG
jgi:hypothetical protein